MSDRVPSQSGFPSYRTPSWHHTLLCFYSCRTEPSLMGTYLVHLSVSNKITYQEHPFYLCSPIPSIPAALPFLSLSILSCHQFLSAHTLACHPPSYSCLTLLLPLLSTHSFNFQNGFSIILFTSSLWLTWTPSSHFILTFTHFTFFSWIPLKIFFSHSALYQTPFHQFLYPLIPTLVLSSPPHSYFLCHIPLHHFLIYSPLPFP